MEALLYGAQWTPIEGSHFSASMGNYVVFDWLLNHISRKSNVLFMPALEEWTSSFYPHKIAELFQGVCYMVIHVFCGSGKSFGLCPSEYFVVDAVGVSGRLLRDIPSSYSHSCVRNSQCTACLTLPELRHVTVAGLGNLLFFVCNHMVVFAEGV